MIERKDEAMLLDEFRRYLYKNKGLKETSVKDDISRINMMKSHNIDYTKGEDFAREMLLKSGLAMSTITSCLRVCRYYREYLNQ